MKKIFVVSCQALENEPLYGKNIMAKMAKAALLGGADWIRTSQVNNIKSIMKQTNVPIIGLIKKVYFNNSIHITPTLKELRQLIKTNVHIIAMDATLRNRPKETLKEMVTWFKQNKRNHQKLMADCSTYEDMMNASKLGFDYISTTLIGYTDKTQNLSLKDKNYFILRKIKKEINIPIVAEGKINTPSEAKKAFEAGADIVVVGGAITRPSTITKRFVEEIDIARGQSDKNKK